ncbi:uncharacterized protein PRCAT00002681001 [Priceomyces carsonii]|uniref:uncharacterized protein n=1 Tax=Priceomyces carsonii TaxID=28549 RepID=UPI002ED92BA5|nr:unnamed protein product [Priceomyces carsonii]
MSSNTDTDDVLDFINSLPDSKSNTPQPPNGEKKVGNQEDLLDFLDELENHDKSKASTPMVAKTKFEPKKKQEKDLNEKTPNLNDNTETNQEVTGEAEVSDRATTKEEHELQSANDELNIDPIGSISSWWQSEGSSKVSSLWGTFTSNAHHISEQTYQIASSTTNQLNQQRQKILSESEGFEEQFEVISTRLNSILLNMSQQIKQGLIDDDDELLNILLINDLDNMSYLSNLCSDKFNLVMDQVEGGIRVSVNNFNHRQMISETARIELNMFHGKIIDGEKLCAANLDSAVKDYQKITKDQEESQSKESSANELDKINKSNIFISIQPISSKVSQDDQKAATSEGPMIIEANNSDSFAFTLILKDVTNNITLITKSQPFPYRWSKWLAGDFEGSSDFDDVDPSEWVKSWIKDGLSLSFGVLAQEYVAKRMGIA